MKENAQNLGRLKGMLLELEELLKKQPVPSTGDKGYTREGHYIFELLNHIKV
jgi:hypothetical protein